ncbi:AtpZ/AtpI family protein [Candidatus Falkowbacteria bacterium]|nr:AtpZ/AtpI family protein [Candidatus Falkowbacteria bacterium]
MSDTSKQQAPWWQPGLILFLKLNGWIVAPVVVAIIIGKWLDGRLGTAPWVMVASIIIAFSLSVFGITRQGLKAMNSQDEKNNKDNKND